MNYLLVEAYEPQKFKALKTLEITRFGLAALLIPAFLFAMAGTSGILYDFSHQADANKNHVLNFDKEGRSSSISIRLKTLQE